MAIAVQTQLRLWLDAVDNMEIRERILLLAAVVVVMFLLADTLILQPTLKQQLETKQRIVDLDGKLNGLRQNALLLNYKSGSDPTASRHQSRNQLVAELDELDNRITRQLDALVEPAPAARILEQVLSGYPGLKLTALNAGTEPIENQNSEPQSKPPSLARYQLNMVIQGNYQDILSYLKNLEAMPWKFYWQQVDFRSTEHAYAETRLQLYTLRAKGV